MHENGRGSVQHRGEGTAALLPGRCSRSMSAFFGFAGGQENFKVRVKAAVRTRPSGLNFQKPPNEEN